MAPAPTPFHILRSHASPLAAITFNPSNTLVYAGDQDGNISITDLRSRRTVSSWRAHEGGILTLQEWNGSLISHGRDNLIHFYDPTPTHGALSNGPGPSRPPPSIESTLTTNALNFCRFSLCPLIPSTSSLKGKDVQHEALLAVPNLVDSELIDIYLLPSKQRLHASINYTPKAKSANTESIIPDAGRTGIVMGIHLAFDDYGRLTCIMGFEDGRVEVWRCGREPGSTSSAEEGSQEQWRETWDARMSTGPRLWHKVWEAKGHNEAIMAMAVDHNVHRAFTVSADHLVVRYDLRPITTVDLSIIVLGKDPNATKSFSTGQIGNASIAVSSDGQVVAVGGWDGNIRLFSAASLKPLGTLAYHRETCHTLAFASPEPHGREAETDKASTIELGNNEDEESDDEDGQGGIGPRSRWLGSGGKDRRIALWSLKQFSMDPTGLVS